MTTKYTPGPDAVSADLSEPHAFITFPGDDAANSETWCAHCNCTWKENGAHFLHELFEYEFCAECGGDAQHHTAVPFMGNWFARCDCPCADDGSLHPAIAQYRETQP